MINLNIDLGPIYKQIVREFKANRGVRIGESTVVSQKIHSIDPVSPGVVTIHSCTDAGKVFYGRRIPGEVVHIDVFHSVGIVDHYKLASAIKKTYESFYEGWPANFFKVLDNIDIQTGSGGGKLTGKLTYGQKKSLKRAHMNHVHMSILFLEEITRPLVHIVDAVEQIIIEQGLEVRKIDKVLYQRRPGNTPMDMSPYSSNTDSCLKQEGAESEQARDARNMQDSLSVAKEFGGCEQAIKVMEAFLNPSCTRKNIDYFNQNYGSIEDVVSQLLDKGLIERRGNGLSISLKGKELYDYLQKNIKEIELNLKKLIRKIPLTEHVFHNGNTITRCHRIAKTGKTSRRSCEPLKDEWIARISVGETVYEAAKRSFLNNQRFKITTDDIRVFTQTDHNSLSICMLVDTSASMAGYRLQSAKFLAEHLILSTRSKVSVIAFQEKKAEVFVPFTRSHSQLRNGLRSMNSFGLTPLAYGIYYSIKRIKSEKIKDPLLLLITDGIPTVPYWGSDPIVDAIKASELIAGEKLHFCCIGLQPNKKCLSKMIERSGGNLYIVDELDKNVLASIAHKEITTHIK